MPKSDLPLQIMLTMVQYNRSTTWRSHEAVLASESNDLNIYEGFLTQRIWRRMDIDREEVLLGDDIVALAGATELPQLLCQLRTTLCVQKQVEGDRSIDECKPILPHPPMIESTFTEIHDRNLQHPQVSEDIAEVTVLPNQQPQDQQIDAECRQPPDARRS